MIVTEGTDTEPAYFGAIRDVINSQYREKVRLDICGEGDNTVNLFRKAKQNVVESPNGYRHVWVVYDTDDFPAEHIDKVVELCRENSNVVQQIKWSCLGQVILSCFRCIV